MRQIRRSLHDLPEEHEPRFVQRQGDDDRDGDTEDKSGPAKEERVRNQLAKVERVDECFKELKADPGAAFNAEQRLEILERNLGVIEGDVLEHEVIEQGGGDQKVHPAMSPHGACQLLETRRPHIGGRGNRRDMGMRFYY